jgi:hypothetical protein
MPHLACVDDTFSEDLLVSPQISDQEELLSIGEEPPSKGNADNELQPNDEEASTGDNKSKESKPFIDWSIEGLDELDGSQTHHVNAFYTLVKNGMPRNSTHLYS